MLRLALPERRAARLARHAHDVADAFRPVRAGESPVERHLLRPVAELRDSLARGVVGVLRAPFGAAHVEICLLVHGKKRHHGLVDRRHDGQGGGQRSVARDKEQGTCKTSHTAYPPRLFHDCRQTPEGHSSLDDDFHPGKRLVFEATDVNPILTDARIAGQIGRHRHPVRVLARVPAGGTRLK